MSQDNASQSNPTPDSTAQDAGSDPDIRQQVDQSRGFQKKLELLVPGLRGYRNREDIRVADDMLRNQVADKLDLAKANLEAVRKQMVSAGDFTNLSTVGSLIFEMQGLSGQVRHAQQGYSGFVASISVNEPQLNKLYEYDYNFVNSAVQLLNATSPQNLIYDPTSPASILPKVSAISSAEATLKQSWSVRMEAVENILVKGQ